MSNFVIAIDAGHGVNGDPGATHKNGRREADDTLRLANAINTECQNRGFKTVVTRTTINSGTLDRAGIAKKAGAGVFLCIHRNAFNGTAKGFETWTAVSFSSKTNEIAQAVQKKCVAVGVLANRGVKRDSNNSYPLITGLERSGIPAILIEYNFVDSTEDNECFDKNINGYAKATVDAVAEVFGLQGGAKPSTPAPAQTNAVYTVVSGDTMSKIAQKHGVTLNALIAANPQIQNASTISIGQKINIPKR